MRGVVLSLALVLFTLVTLGLPRDAAAQADRIPFLSEKLRDPDFRVRTNAALALGATSSDSAVDPLCGALGDSVDVVRQASAAGLQRLNRKKGLPCLNERSKVESNDTVRSQIQKAVAALESGGIGDGGGGGGATPPSVGAPKDNANAKYYVQIAPITNGTDRNAKEIDALVRAAVMAKLDSLGAYQVAPSSESIDGAKSAMSKRKLKNGFYLTLSVAPVSYSGGIRASVSVAISSYPGKSLKATLSGSSQGSGGKGDTANENQVIERATQTAIGTFAQNIEALL